MTEAGAIYNALGRHTGAAGFRSPQQTLPNTPVRLLGQRRVDVRVACGFKLNVGLGLGHHSKPYLQELLTAVRNSIWNGQSPVLAMNRVWPAPLVVSHICVCTGWALVGMFSSSSSAVKHHSSPP